MKTAIFAILLCGMCMAKTIPTGTFTTYTTEQLTAMTNLTYLTSYYSDNMIYSAYRYTQFSPSDTRNGEQHGATATTRIMRFGVRYDHILSCLPMMGATNCYNTLFIATTPLTYNGMQIIPMRAQRDSFLISEVFRAKTLQTKLAQEAAYNTAIGLDWLITQLRRDG